MQENGCMAVGELVVDEFHNVCVTLSCFLEPQRGRGEIKYGEGEGRGKMDLELVCSIKKDPKHK